MLRNVMLTLAYDGTDFHGWQNQPGMRTVQDCLEQAVRRSARHQINLIGSGRTDAGVHAAGQVANFYTISPAKDIALLRSIGSRIPKDITLIHAQTVPLTFHATRSAISKLYRYRIHNRIGRPVEQQHHRHVNHFWHPVDIDKMRDAAACWLGTHDFSAFAAKGNVRLTNVRTILRIDIYRVDWEIRVDIEGTGFLYNQVRNMVGTLLEIGRGHWPVSRAAEILASRDRQRAGPTAPARGLCLQWVRYDLTALPSPSPEMLSRAEAGELPMTWQRRDADAAAAPASTGDVVNTSVEPESCDEEL